MKNIKTISQTILPMVVVSIFLSTTTKAQSAYHGGNGDGYASAEIKNVVLNINPSLNQTRSVNLYPNPAKTSENLQIITTQSALYQVEIINILGQVAFTKYFDACKENIPLSGFKPGSYIVYVSNERFSYIQKLVIANP